MKRKQKSNPSFFHSLTADDFTRDRLQLPPDFVRKHHDILPREAKLKSISSVETWDVKIQQNDRYGKCVCFTKGWNKFVKDHKLEVGGFCVFWFHKDESTFDVAAYEIHGTQKEIEGHDSRVKSEPDSEDDQNVVSQDDSVSDENLEEIEESESESEAEFDNPSCPNFEVVLKDYQYSRLVLPSKFTQKAGLIGRKAVVLQYAPTQRFSAVVLDQQRSRLDFAFGWNEFQRQNGLVCGKTYSFVFNWARNVIQVHPVSRNLRNETEREKKRKRPDVRNSGRGKQNLASNCILDRPGSSSKITNETGTVNKGRSKTYQSAKAFRERNMVQRSSFVSYMQPSYISSNMLTIPRSFVMDTYHREVNEIELRVSNGKKWPLLCKYCMSSAYLCGGWGSFAKDNRLKVGDACAFEVNRSNKFVWDVTIFRS